MRRALSPTLAVLALTTLAFLAALVTYLSVAGALSIEQLALATVFLTGINVGLAAGQKPRARRQQRGPKRG